MSDRDAAIFVITSDKNQTIKEAILKEKKEIMKVIKFDRWVKDCEINNTPSKVFNDIFIDNSICFYVYTYEPKFDLKKIFDVKRGESFLAIFSVNSAGSWEILQVIPLKVNSLNNSNINYYTKRETIIMPS
jgi:hypothetical protein